MAEVSGLRQLARAGGSAAMDETQFANDEPVPRSDAVGVTRWLPRQRGTVQPVLGTVGDPAALRALTLSDGGWLHEDGRLVADGTFRANDALRVAPEMAAVFERLDAEVKAVEASREAAWDALLAHYQSMGLSENCLIGDCQEHGYVDDIDERHPMPDHRAEFARAGWIRLAMSRQGDAKMISVRSEPAEGRSYEDHLLALSGALRCQVDDPFAPAPSEAGVRP